MLRSFPLLFLAVSAVAATTSLEDDILNADQKGKKSVHAVLARDKDSDPSTKFTADTPKISAFWKGQSLNLGDRLRGVWIAEDIGMADRKDSIITEASVVAYKPDDDGAFALARPKEGWPAGKYRFEIYVDDKLVEKVRFTIEPSAAVEVR